MATLRLIEPLPLQRLQSLLNDGNVPVQPIMVQYEDYIIRNTTRANDSPLRFLWWKGAQPEPLFFSLSTRGAKKSKENPGAHLIIGTKADDRIVGYLLTQMPQDDAFVYLSFRMGNGEGGNNRWFGRGRHPHDQRPDEAMRQLHGKLPYIWRQTFLDPMPPHPTLPGDWLLLARLPLAELDPATAPAKRSALKTLILERLAQAFVIAEKLRDESFVSTETPTTTNTTASSLSLKMATPLNQILYGPPGTGKTYYTKARAVGIIEGLTDKEVAANYTREAIGERFEEYRQAGQVEFVTFHQAFGYEDFVEGIKPSLGSDDTIKYRVEQGVFKLICSRAIQAHNAYFLQDDAFDIPTSHPVKIGFEELYDRFFGSLSHRVEEEGLPLPFPVENRETAELLEVDMARQSLLFSRPDTDVGRYKIDRRPIESMYNTYDTAEEITNLAGDKRVNDGGANIRLLKAVFAALKKFEKNIPLDFETGKTRAAILEKYVLIIDEINRGNVANIFGELITLLEDDKRAGRPEALTVKLPYSKEDFTVPENLYLLGTMNTADRSVEALDTALRRRFSFTEMLPDAGVIRGHVGDNGVVEGIDAARLLEVLNSRLEQLLDHDHCLGHALLLRIGSLEELRAAFQRNILPLLQEYFFGDWGKIGLVLGEKFITAVEAKSLAALAKFGKYPGGNGREKPIYRLTKPESWDAAAFQSIYATT